MAFPPIKASERDLRPASIGSLNRRKHAVRFAQRLASAGKIVRIELCDALFVAAMCGSERGRVPTEERATSSRVIGSLGHFENRRGQHRLACRAPSDRRTIRSRNSMQASGKRRAVSLMNSTSPAFSLAASTSRRAAQRSLASSIGRSLAASLAAASRHAGRFQPRCIPTMVQVSRCKAPARLEQAHD